MDLGPFFKQFKIKANEKQPKWETKFCKKFLVYYTAKAVCGHYICSMQSNLQNKNQAEIANAITFMHIF